MKNEKIDAIELVVKNILEKMGFSAEVSVKEQEGAPEEAFLCEIKTDESSFLIGQHGANLEAIEHLARTITRKLLEDRVKFSLDVNSYRQERSQSIIALAKDMAEKAITEKRAVVLRPMSPFERRLVHLELSQNPQVITESTGDNENRKVIIKPVSLI